VLKAVVTGSAGFIGSHLCDYLREQGHDVLGLDALLPGRGDLQRIRDFGLDRFSHADIRDPGIREWVGWADCVFHTAAVSSTPWAVSDPVTCNDINVNGTLNLLECARQAKVKRFVFSSSNIVYAAPTAYKVSKLAAEGYCEAYEHLYGLSAVSLRYSNVFGSLRQNTENVVMAMRESARRDGMVKVTGDGQQSRDFTNVADICRANLLAAMSQVTGHLDICTGENRTMNEVASYFGVPVVHVEPRQGDIRHIRQDPGPARDKLGFAAEIPFDEGMKAYL
jgi:UDP-glucose 4-epimerase